MPCLHIKLDVLPKLIKIHGVVLSLLKLHSICPFVCLFQHRFSNRDHLYSVRTSLRFCWEKSGLVIKTRAPNCFSGAIHLATFSLGSKENAGRSNLNGSGGAVCTLNVKRWQWRHLHIHDSIFPPFTFLFTLLILACVKGCNKAARHNKPSALLTGASAEAFTYDIVYLFCNQSVLIWDTIAFHGLGASKGGRGDDTGNYIKFKLSFTPSA